MAPLRAVVVAAAIAAALVPVSASACQWEFYEETYETPVGPVTVPMAHCVGP